MEEKVLVGSTTVSKAVGTFGCGNRALFLPPNGEVSERPKEHVWKTCARVKACQGFESLSHRKNVPERV